MVVSFTCTVAVTNPAVDTFTFYENGIVVSNKMDSGAWIKTLDTGGEMTYKCQANNSVGTSSSRKILLSVKGEATKFLFFKNVSTTIIIILQCSLTEQRLTDLTQMFDFTSKALLVPLILYVEILKKNLVFEGYTPVFICHVHIKLRDGLQSCIWANALVMCQFHTGLYIG